MGKKKRALLSRLTVSQEMRELAQEMRELAIAHRQNVKDYHGDVPVYILWEERAMRLEGIPG